MTFHDGPALTTQQLQGGFRAQEGIADEAEENRPTVK